MYFNFKKIIFILTILLFLLVLIPSSFADDSNETDSNYYFNASCDVDGDGTINNPYNELNDDRIIDNSNFYLSNGNYSLKQIKSYTNISFYGEDTSKTIIDGKGETLAINDRFVLSNITLFNFTIFNQGNLTATNTVFSSSDTYTYYGAIYSINSSYSVFLVNCTFINNYATYGGAIYMNGGVLGIVNSSFINNTADNWGGSIVCEDNTNITINNTEFNNSKSNNDAGGAIYLKSSIFNADNITINNSYATFGGAITSLNSQINLSNFVGYNNHVNYEGGAIYHLYGNFSISNSRLINNTAKNGAGIFVDNSTHCCILSNTFINNTALQYGGAIYSLYNNLTIDNIQYLNNNASFYNDLYNTSSLNVIISSGNYTMYNVSITDMELPTRYNSSYVTSVKNQGAGGNCWAFATIAALESCILKASGDNLDLSEENMKNLMALYSDYGWDRLTNDGGYDDMSLGYLVSWLGPVNESDDVYNPKSLLSPILDSIMHVQNIIFLDRHDYTDNDAIKRAIVDYGAVATSLFMTGNLYQYYTGNSSVNHAVAIVGWDDELNITGAPGLGAWICKNSWGSSWGDNGYFYVSYYDVRFASVNASEVTYTFVLNDTLRFDKNYQYDVAGKTDYFLVENSSVFYKNIFKATTNELITAVSTYFQKTTNWTLSILVNDELKHIQNGVSDNGYYTIILNNFIPLSVGDIFEIVFNITVDGDAGFPISEIVSLKKLIYSENTSFFSLDGETWNDLFNYTHEYPGHTYASQVACIKAFTSLNYIVNSTVDLTLTYIGNNSVFVKANAYDQYGHAVRQGNITFSIEDKLYVIDIINGSANITYNFTNSGIKMINASFNGDVYNSSNTSAFIDLSNITVVSSFYIGNITYGEDLIANISLVDQYGNLLTTNVSLIINNSTYLVSVIEGKALFKIPVLSACEYYAYIKLDDEFYSNSTINTTFHVNSTILYPNVTKYAQNAICQIKLLDKNGNPLKNNSVNINISGKVYNKITDLNGFVSFNLDLTPKSYTITVTNPSNNEKVSQNINIVSRITGNKDITLYYGSKLSYKIRVYDDTGKIASGVKVTFKVNGKTYTKFADKNGYAVLSTSLNVGKYTVKASYNGVTISNKIIVKPTLTAKDITKKKVKKIKFQAKLLNSKGKVLKGKKITFKIKGKTYKAKTNSKGIATIIIKNLKVGKYKITTSYSKLKISNKILIKK